MASDAAAAAGRAPRRPAAAATRGCRKPRPLTNRASPARATTPEAIPDETNIREGVENTDADAEPYVAPEESLPAEVIAEATASAGGASGENTEDGFSSVDSDDPVEEMAPRVELGEPPLIDGETIDEEGPTVEIERQAARDEAAEAADAEPDEDESEDEEDGHDEVTTLGGGGEGDEPVRNVRPRADDEGEPVESIGGDAMDEAPRRASRPRRHYKIQEVIKRRQVLLVQVVKEERGNKGAALTTYLSLAGRYSVLMPNTARGGGISRKITNAHDRSRLKAIAEELDVPEGMGVILRTAGASRTKPEVKRDFEYLLRMWETVRETTLASTAPTLVYEEGSLIKRAIRDLYSKEIDEIVVAGENGYKEAKNFMRLLMPGNTKAVTPYRDTAPVFAKSGVEAQLDAMFSNQVTLRSGGYIVINQTEALVAIDVNSGRSTREHNIEDTALRTNLEAADEIARQLRLRDLAGLIVVDFIDMEETRNNRAVERRMKEALKNDRARIQVGRISHFGLLEMSRQRIRTGVLEGSTVACPHCMGAGVVRSTSSVALHVLRVIEDALLRNAQFDMNVRARTAVALYILNHKRAHLRDLERRFGVDIFVVADDTLAGGVNHALERGEPARGVREEPEVAPRPGYGVVADDEFAADEAPEPEAEEEEVAAAEVEDEAEAEEENEPRAEAAETTESADEEAERGRRRRRRRRRGGERGDPAVADAPQPADDGLAFVAEIGGDFAQSAGGAPEEGGRANGSRRRRSRRGRRDRFGPRVDETQPGEEGEFEAGPGSEPLHGDPALGGIETAAAMESARLHRGGAGGAAAGGSDASRAGRRRSRRPLPPRPLPRAAPEPPAAQVAPEPEPEADEPPRPRRTGWWQRAKSTLVGD